MLACRLNSSIERRQKPGWPRASRTGVANMLDRTYVGVDQCGGGTVEGMLLLLRDAMVVTSASDPRAFDADPVLPRSLEHFQIRSIENTQITPFTQIIHYSPIPYHSFIWTQPGRYSPPSVILTTSSSKNFGANPPSA